MTTNGFDMVTLTPITPPGPGLRLHLLDDDDLAGGVGGWERVARPRRGEVLEWTGTPLWTKTVPLRLDGMDYRDGSTENSVEEEINRLISWGQPSGPTGEPTVFLLDGPLIAPAQNPAWVIDGISWGTRWRRSDRHRIAQEVQVSLLEFAAPEVLLSPAAAARARAAR